MHPSGVDSHSALVFAPSPPHSWEGRAYTPRGLLTLSICTLGSPQTTQGLSPLSRPPPRVAGFSLDSSVPLLSAISPAYGLTPTLPTTGPTWRQTLTATTYRLLSLLPSGPGCLGGGGARRISPARLRASPGSGSLPRAHRSLPRSVTSVWAAPCGPSLGGSGTPRPPFQDPLGHH